MKKNVVKLRSPGPYPLSTSREKTKPRFVLRRNTSKSCDAWQKRFGSKNRGLKQTALPKEKNRSSEEKNKIKIRPRLEQIQRAWEEGFGSVDGEGERDNGLGAGAHYHALHPQPAANQVKGRC